MAITIKEMAALIDTRGTYGIGRDVWMDVTITDLRTSYGQVQALVTPVAGKGSMWVNLDSVKVV